jgi:hypothetical protein
MDGSFWRFEARMVTVIVPATSAVWQKLLRTLNELGRHWRPAVRKYLQTVQVVLSGVQKLSQQN